MRFAEIQHGSAEYLAECELRQQVLRAPLGMNLFDEDLDSEIDQRHFGWFLECGTLAACAIAVAVSPVEMKIRQMAVRADSQRSGHGRKLMTAIEGQLAKSGTRILSLHARSQVTGFYQSLGFEPVGDEFLEIGIPHLKMVKSIRPVSPPERGS